MAMLFKYELRKTWFTKVILLIITLVAEAAYLIGLYSNNERMTSVAIAILMMLAFGGIFVMGLESVITLHRDMNTRQGYMLFMTPNSCYRILGAKMLECAVSILLAGAFFFALGALDITLLFAQQGALGKIREMFTEMLSSFTIAGRPILLDAPNLAAFFFSMLASWILVISTAYFADVISTAILYGKKYNGILSFLLFLALSWGISWLTSLVGNGIHTNIGAFVAEGSVSLAITVAMYIVTARIMETKLSV